MGRKGRAGTKRVAPVAKLFPPQGQWTEDGYFALPETNRLLELSEGRLIRPPHPPRSQQEAIKKLSLRLWSAKIRESEGIER